MKPKILSKKTLRVLLIVLIVAIAIAVSIPRLIFSGPLHAPVAAAQPGQRRAVLIDTDASFDDVAAILYLLQRSDVDIVGITTVDGVAHPDKGVDSIQRLLNMMGRADIPVVPGTVETPYADKYIPSSWRFQVDNFPKLFFPSPPGDDDRPETSSSAAEFIIETAKGSEAPLTLIALGPLTNLAGAYQLDPNLPHRLQGVVFSGGILVDEPDSPFQDLNVLADPAAAQAVFKRGESLTIIPIDPVAGDRDGQVFGYDQTFISNLDEQARWREMELLAFLFKVQTWTGTTLQNKAVPVWDLTALQIFADPKTCTDWRKVNVQVQDEDPGRLIFSDSRSGDVSVCYAVDAGQLESSLLAINQED